MPDNNNPAQPAGAEAPASTTEQLLRLLNQQPKGPNGGDDALNNPELEQLFGSLSKGLEKGIADSALGLPQGEPLTLEALAASVAQPPALGEIPIAQPARAATVACPKCGAANPAATRFCGMCGQGLGAGGPRASGNGAKPMVVATEPPKLTQFGSRTGSSLGFKTALLGVLVLALGLVVYQQQLWRLRLLTGVISNFQGAWTSPATKAAAEVAPAPVKLPEPVNREPASVVRTPVTVVKPSKAARPTVITRSLPGPTPLPSAPPPLEIPLPVEAPVAVKSPEPPPVEKAPATAPEVAAPEPQPARISQSVPGVLTQKVNPQYPAAARAARVQGAVVMHALIGVDGTIQQLQVVSGNPLLVNAAMEAVKRWRYRPYLLNGNPVEVETNITVDFKGE